MSKLFKLKEWLTVEETAAHLTTVLGESVQKSDVLRLALDKHLVLSMNFINHAYGNLGKIVDVEDARWEKYNPEMIKALFGDEARKMPMEYMKGVVIDEHSVIDWDDEVKKIDGVWDLMLVGSELLDVEYKYHQLIGGPEVTLVGIDGAFVRNGDVTCRLVESFDDNEFKPGSSAFKEKMEAYIGANSVPAERVEEMRSQFETDRKKYLADKLCSPYENDFFPAGGLPRDGVYVVRTAAIVDFLDRLNETPKIDKPISAKERNSLLTLIAALCNEANFDNKQRGIAASLAASTEKLGKPLTDDTIRNILKQVKDLLS